MQKWHFKSSAIRSIWIPLRKLFLTSQAVNPRFPLHVPSFRSLKRKASPIDQHPDIQKFVYAFAVKGFCALNLFSAFEVLLSWPLRQGQVHSFMTALSINALQRQISQLSAPPSKRLFVISQILGDTSTSTHVMSTQTQPGSLDG